MNVIRPASFDDIDGIYELSLKTGPGLTTLPEDKTLLEEKVEQSQHAFVDGISEPGLEYYFFVLEDTTTGHIAGTSALAATVGLEEACHLEALLNLRRRDRVGPLPPLAADVGQHAGELLRGSR